MQLSVETDRRKTVLTRVSGLVVTRRLNGMLNFHGDLTVCLMLRVRAKILSPWCYHLFIVSRYVCIF